METYRQDDWIQLLLLDEFDYNYTKHTSLARFHLFVNHGFHPHLGVNSRMGMSTKLKETPSSIKKIHWQPVVEGLTVV